MKISNSVFYQNSPRVVNKTWACNFNSNLPHFWRENSNQTFVGAVERRLETAKQALKMQKSKSFKSKSFSCVKFSWMAAVAPVVSIPRTVPFVSLGSSSLSYVLLMQFLANSQPLLQLKGSDEESFGGHPGYPSRRPRNLRMESQGRHFCHFALFRNST